MVIKEPLMCFQTSSRHHRCGRKLTKLLLLRSELNKRNFGSNMCIFFDSRDIHRLRTDSELLDLRMKVSTTQLPTQNHNTHPFHWGVTVVKSFRFVLMTSYDDFENTALSLSVHGGSFESVIRDKNTLTILLQTC